MSQSKTTQERWWAFFFSIAIVGIIVITILLIDKKELPSTIVGALLGVAMTVFATYFLFKGQSKHQTELLEQQQSQQLSLIREQHRIESDQEKESEIFKQKLIAYKAFLEALREYVAKPDEDSKKLLIFHSMSIRMHCNDDVVELLDNNIIAIINSASEENEIEVLISSLNNIAYIFREELYKTTLPSSSPNLKKFEEAILGSVEGSSDQKDIDEEPNQDLTKVMPWNTKINQLTSKGWVYIEGNDSFIIKRNDSPIEISVYRKKGKYVVGATNGDDDEFAQSLKDNFKGYKRYGKWWHELPISNYKVTQGTLLKQLPDNDKARASVIKWVDRVVDFISNN